MTKDNAPSPESPRVDAPRAQPEAVAPAPPIGVRVSPVLMPLPAPGAPPDAISDVSTSPSQPSLPDVVPQELTNPGERGVSSKTPVMPQEITSPGAELSFSPPQRMVRTEVVARRRSGSESRIAAPPPQAVAAQERMIHLEAELRFWRRAAKSFLMLNGVLSLVVLGLVFIAVRKSAEPNRLPVGVAGRPDSAGRTPPGADTIDAPPTEPDPDRAAAEAPPGPAEAMPDLVQPPPERRRRAPASPDRAERVDRADRAPPPAAAPLSSPGPTEVSRPLESPRQIRFEDENPGRASNAELRALIAQLRASPTPNAALFDKARRAIAAGAETVPLPEQRKIRSRLNSADLSLDVDQLARALDMLESARGGR